MGHYGLFVKFKTAPGQSGTLASMLLDAAAIMDNAKGCRQYLVYRDGQDEDTICVNELWDSKTDHDNALDLPGCRALILRAMPLLAGKPESVSLDLIGGKMPRSDSGI